MAMLLLPLREQIRPAGQAAHYTVDVVLGNGLKDNAAKLVFEELDLSASRDPVFAAKFRRNHQLALGGKSSTYLSYSLHISISKTYAAKWGGAIFVLPRQWKTIGRGTNSTRAD